MIDTDKYEGHNMHPALLDVGEDYNNWDALQDMGFNDEARQLIAAAPLLLEEVKRLHKEVDQLSIDVCESLELILDVHHPEVKDSVMSMFGDAIGNNWPYYETLE